MKCLILAGGFGTRLRPLSCTLPKLLFPVANRPILDWTIENLAKHGIDEVILAVNYMAETIMRYFGTSRHGVIIRYSREKRPLGTAGPILNARKLLGDEPFLMMNGDIFSDINYSALVEAHRSKEGAVGTICLYEIENPGRYGVVDVDEDMRVKRFVEKPTLAPGTKKPVNAGVYVLDPSIFDYIPEEERKISLEVEVFPKLAEERKLYAYRHEGMWVDIGVPADYLRANRLLLEKLAAENPVIGENAKIHPEAKISNLTVIGDDVEIGKGSYIGPYTVLGNGVSVGEGCRIEGSILFDDVSVDNYTSIKGAIIGKSAMIGKWVKIEEEALLGDYVEVADNVTIVSGVTICHSKSVEESILEPTRIM